MLRAAVSTKCVPLFFFFFSLLPLRFLPCSGMRLGAGPEAPRHRCFVALTNYSSTLASLMCCFVLFFSFFFLLSSAERKRNSSFSLIEPVVLNDGRPPETHAQVKRGPLFPEPTGQMHQLSPESVFYTHESLARHSFFFSFLF